MVLDREFSWRRCSAWAFAIGVHAALLVSMSVPMRIEDEAVVVSFEAERWIDRERFVPVELPAPIRPTPGEQRPVVSATPRVEPRRVRRRKREDASGAEHADDDSLLLTRTAVEAPFARPLAFLDDEARAKLPHEPMFAAGPPAREGDFHTPGDGSEDDVFYRPLALEPNTTRFERVWQPTGTLGGDTYRRLVELTTGTVRVPLNPKFSLVCGASIAGLGGGCVIVRDGGTGIIVERPPEAPWDRANRVQCRELRDQLEAAESADDVAFFLDRLTALCTGSEAESGRRP